MQEIVQQKAEVAATVAASGAATGWIAFLAELNEVLITVSTLIAIVAGAWTLYDKWRVKRDSSKAKENGTD